MVVPSLPALLTDSTRKMVGDLGPLLGAMLVNQRKQHAILHVSPRSLDQGGVQDLLPSVEALDVSPADEFLGNPLPWLAAILCNCLCQELVFLFCPVALHLASFGVGSRLRLLVFGGSTFVKMRVEHLMPNQILLNFSIRWILVLFFLSSFQIFVINLNLLNLINQLILVIKFFLTSNGHIFLNHKALVRAARHLLVKSQRIRLHLAKIWWWGIHLVDFDVWELLDFQRVLESIIWKLSTFEFWESRSCILVALLFFK